MSTRDTLFKFHCRNDHGLNQTLEFVHPIPSSLITTTGHDDPSYLPRFSQAIVPILLQHGAACQAASSTKCEVCASPPVKVVQTPISLLYLVKNPLVDCFVTAVCEKADCATKARKTTDMRAREEFKGDVEPDVGREVMLCGACGRVDNVKKCGGCGVVAYCGKECQKKDWEMHKQVCGSQDK